ETGQRPQCNMLMESQTSGGSEWHDLALYCCDFAHGFCQYREDRPIDTGSQSAAGSVDFRPPAFACNSYILRVLDLRSYFFPEQRAHYLRGCNQSHRAGLQPLSALLEYHHKRPACFLYLSAPFFAGFPFPADNGFVTQALPSL